MRKPRIATTIYLPEEAIPLIYTELTERAYALIDNANGTPHQADRLIIDGLHDIADAIKYPTATQRSFPHKRRNECHEPSQKHSNPDTSPHSLESSTG